MMSSVKVSSGVRFAERAVVRKSIPVDEDKVSFLEKAPAFALTPDFFNMGLLDENGSYCQLKGFDGNCAIIDRYERIAGKYETERQHVDYEWAAKQMLTMAQAELDEVKNNEMSSINEAGFCFDTTSSQCDKETKREVLAELKERISILEESLLFYNGNMSEVEKEMNLPYRCGCKLGDTIFEFVSYRADLGATPYILEDISRRGRNKRLFAVSFDSLLKRAMAFADEEDCSDIDFKKVKEMKAISDVEDINLGAEEDGQILLFA